MKPRVLVTLKMPEAHLSPLDGVAEMVMATEEWNMMPRTEVLRLAPEMDAIITQGELQVDGELLEAATQLKIVANVAIGIDNFDTDAMASRGVWATNAPSSFTDCTADCAMALLLALARKIPEGHAYVTSGRWESDGMQPRRWEGVLLAGKTMGIVGYGEIGKAVAGRAKAFGMQVIFNRARPDSDPAHRDLDTLLAEADVVSLHIPLTSQTRGLIDAAALARMKPGALLINLARGKCVDEAALAAALRSGHLGGAGLDVFENEPRVHPELLEMPNVVLAPHIGGSTVESRRDARLLAAENVALVLAGKAPKTPVNAPRC